MLRLFGSERLIGITAKLGLDENTPIDARILSRSIEGAQRRIEANNFARRKNVLTYDDVMNQQRKVIYEQRRDVLFENNIKEKIVGMITQSVTGSFDSLLGGDEVKIDEFKNHYQGLITDSKNFNYTEDELAAIDKDKWCAELVGKRRSTLADRPPLSLHRLLPQKPTATMRRC